MWYDENENAYHDMRSQMLQQPVWHTEQTFDFVIMLAVSCLVGADYSIFGSRGLLYIIPLL